MKIFLELKCVLAGEKFNGGKHHLANPIPVKTAA
jgi:hypothetical protein